MPHKKMAKPIKKIKTKMPCNQTPKQMREKNKMLCKRWPSE
jgi:hypothetical protein